MSEASWVEVDAKKLSEAERASEETIRGVKVSVRISPFDLPNAFRGFHVKERGVFRIEFKYVDDEPAIKEIGDSVVSLELGEFSRKLLAIEVEVDKLGVEVVSLQIVTNALNRADDTVKQLQRRANRPSARLNYRAVDQVLQQGKENPALLVNA